MECPDASPCTYEDQQIQSQQYEPNQEGIVQNNQQYQQMSTVGNDPVAQQHQQAFQPQQEQFRPQQPPTYPPPQPNQAYPPAQQHAPYPPQNLQNNGMYLYKPNQKVEAYPYLPQPMQCLPNQFQLQPTNQMHANVSTAVTNPQSLHPPPQTFPQPTYLPLPDHGMTSAPPLQQGGQIPAAVAGEGWKTDLLDIFEDPANALLTFFVPCSTFGQITEIVDEGHTSCGTSAMTYGIIYFLIGVPCLISCTYRTKLRNKFGIPEGPTPDWLIHFLCEPCALCQEYRELKLRAWDPSIGYRGNQARMQQQSVMMAPPNQIMRT